MPPARSVRGSTVRIIIALAAQQFREQIRVGARAAVDLRGIGRLLAVGLERGLLRNALSSSSALPIGAEALDRPAVANLRSPLLGRLLTSRGLRPGLPDSALFRGIEVRPVDAEVGHRIERRRRVELGRDRSERRRRRRLARAPETRASAPRRPRTAAARPSALIPARSSAPALTSRPERRQYRSDFRARELRRRIALKNAGLVDGAADFVAGSAWRSRARSAASGKSARHCRRSRLASARAAASKPASSPIALDQLGRVGQGERGHG